MGTKLNLTKKLGYQIINYTYIFYIFKKSVMQCEWSGRHQKPLYIFLYIKNKCHGKQRIRHQKIKKKLFLISFALILSFFESHFNFYFKLNILLFLKRMRYIKS